MGLVEWEPSLRAMYTGRPIYDPSELELPGLEGAPLDPERTFTTDDSHEEMAHFLRTAGYLLVRNVFRADEIEAFLAEADELRGEAQKGDQLSWWGKNASGDEILCRVTRAGSKARLHSIPNDSRLLDLVALADEPLAHRARGSEEGVTVIFKNPDMTEGLSDIPWHRDCGMGGHAVMCPVLIASVFLTPATPETGELKMLPGSWKTACPYIDPSHEKAPRGARFDARPGDVSLHYGDVMHAAPPPTRSDLEQYRISAVTAYARPGVRNHRGDKSYNQVLHGREDGQIEHLSKVADRS
jgi:ectoine hydroxylase-related dioxygenase (phytanoyl-CoA dioxygenase family)